MTALDILLEKWDLFLALVGAFIVGFVGGEILFRVKKVKALEWAEQLDSRRKFVAKPLFKIVQQSRGMIKAVFFIFGVNLIGAAFFAHTVCGVLIVIPFIHLALAGLLISLVMRRYPERLPLVILIPFEIGAFVVAGVGGVSIGLSVFTGGDTLIAIREWATLFFIIVIPLQFIAAFGEAVLLHRLFILQGRPWPQWLLEENDR